MKMSKANKIKFGKKIKELREGACLTQEKLAFKSGMAVATICKIEKGRGASLTTIGLLADALGVKPDILKGE
jgi:transcriptional regulator with XRE-family HTH domain